MKRKLIFLIMICVGPWPTLANQLKADIPWSPLAPAEAVRLTCKQVSDCREAVILWCGGYYGADRDHDGIPCETVCHSRQQVEAIEQEIGCSL